MMLAFLLAFIFAYFIVKLISKSKKKSAEPEYQRINMVLERDGELVYAFDKDTNRFLGQASDMGEMIDCLRSRFPRTQFITIEAEMEKVGWGGQYE